MKALALFALLWVLPACLAERADTSIERVHLGPGAATGSTGWEALRRSFRTRNPGYDLSWQPRLATRTDVFRSEVFFIQTGEGELSLSGAGRAPVRSKVAVGDLVLLRPGERLEVQGEIGALCVVVPAPPPAELPAFIRPDWDPALTDTPGGCATETGAYRRILLTWLGKNGPYLYHALNAHRVRITDSFSHYHPVRGGFDELYLVQMAGPEARLIVSERVDLIESPESVSRQEAGELLSEIRLRAGDLVLLPRGTMHRGLGGVLAQVITVPGFVPGAEIGVDHHLKAINERLGLEAGEALPFHEEAASARVVK